MTDLHSFFYRRGFRVDNEYVGFVKASPVRKISDLVKIKRNTALSDIHTALFR